MTETENGHLPMGLTGALPANFGLADTTKALQLAHSMFRASKPPTQSLLGYALASSEWTLLGYDRNTGLVFDQVNALRPIWWHHSTPENRQEFFTAVDNLGYALRQADAMS